MKWKQKLKLKCSRYFLLEGRPWGSSRNAGKIMSFGLPIHPSIHPLRLVRPGWMDGKFYTSIHASIFCCLSNGAAVSKKCPALAFLAASSGSSGRTLRFSKASWETSSAWFCPWFTFIPETPHLEDILVRWRSSWTESFQCRSTSTQRSSLTELLTPSLATLQSELRCLFLKMSRSFIHCPEFLSKAECRKVEWVFTPPTFDLELLELLHLGQQLISNL